MKNITTTVEELITGLRTAMDPRARADEFATAMQPFGPDGPWRYAPMSERRAAEERIQTDQGRRAGVALYRLERFVNEHATSVQVDIEGHRLTPPDPATAWERTSGSRALSAEATFTRDLLDEARRARFDRELHDAPPSVILRQYTLAAVDPHDQHNASLISYVERQHGHAWNGPAVDNPDERAAVLRLRQAIETARDARVPPDLRASADALQAARVAIGQYQALGVTPIAPTADDAEDEA